MTHSLYMLFMFMMLPVLISAFTRVWYETLAAFIWVSIMCTIQYVLYHLSISPELDDKNKFITFILQLSWLAVGTYISYRELSVTVKKAP